MSVFAVKIIGVFCYFDDFLDDTGTVGLDTSVGTSAVFCFRGVFDYRWSMVLQLDVSEVFRNPRVYVATPLAELQSII
jgi:hypothetical protein